MSFTIVKIEFEKPMTNFGNGAYVWLTHPTTNETITMNFDSYSRIDGNPIFRINKTNINSFTRPLHQFQLNDNNTLINIKDITLINTLEDNVKYMTYQYENEKEIINFILDHCNMTHDDLNKQDAYKMVIRQLKLNNIIKD